MSGTVTLWADTLESLELMITTTADPTATPPKFGFSSTPAQPGTWVNGSWSGTYNSTTKQTKAVTPTLGATGAGLTIATGTTYTMWAQITVGTEVAKWPVGTVVVP